ncbi:hypothetical protein C7974DRAFT_379268 [Boeremia exigua]|uniref:uncharacterized protein n=1 Tax=Boeremia exigua TaxID=749465 RepID=UPI001E8E0040|nr:uncharacterized protein C7974DRAFT_379268 [Boeremia exigua]KAH6616340.1 hypothetical protein C7974DRAFT_379268 [Boeremia exigua]
MTKRKPTPYEQRGCSQPASSRMRTSSPPTTFRPRTPSPPIARTDSAFEFHAPLSPGLHTPPSPRETTEQHPLCTRPHCSHPSAPLAPNSAVQRVNRNTTDPRTNNDQNAKHARFWTDTVFDQDPSDVLLLLAALELLSLLPGAVRWVARLPWAWWAVWVLKALWAVGRAMPALTAVGLCFAVLMVAVGSGVGILFVLWAVVVGRGGCVGSK